MSVNPHVERSLDAPSPEHVVVGLSGGVDSAVAALTLVEAGHRVSAVFMQNWEDDDEHCTARQDYRDASGVAARLGIPLDTVNFADEYWERVFAHFLTEYRAGRTPNPDVLCNREIKFQAFLEHALRHGADAIATGHYVQRRVGEHGVELLRGRDADKDQSYFLHTLDQRQLGAARFPIGDLCKATVRQRAAAAGLHVHGKKDSTGICFIGERKFRDFLAEYLPAQPGDIVDDSGRRLGRHTGLMFYTLGQRQGLGIGGHAERSESPWYVLEKQLDSNTLVVGQGHDHPALLRCELDIHAAQWIAGKPPADAFRATARVRYRQQDQPAHVTVRGDGLLHVHFDNPVRAATPGQSLVIYDNERCLGGGIISDLELDTTDASQLPAMNQTATPLSLDKRQ